MHFLISIPRNNQCDYGDWGTPNTAKEGISFQVLTLFELCNPLLYKIVQRDTIN